MDGKKIAEVLEKCLIKHSVRELSDRETTHAAICLAFWEYAERLTTVYGDSPNSRIERHIANFLPGRKANRYGNFIRESYFSLFNALCAVDRPMTLPELPGLIRRSVRGTPNGEVEAATTFARMCYAILKYQPVDFPVLERAGGTIEHDEDIKHDMKVSWWSLDARYWVAPNFAAAVRRFHREIHALANEPPEAARPLGSIGAALSDNEIPTPSWELSDNEIPAPWEPAKTPPEIGLGTLGELAGTPLAAARKACAAPAGLSPIVRGIRAVAAQFANGTARSRVAAPEATCPSPSAAPKDRAGDAKPPACRQEAAAAPEAPENAPEAVEDGAADEARLDFASLAALTTSLKAVEKRRGMRMSTSAATRAKILLALRAHGGQDIRELAAGLGISLPEASNNLVNLCTMGLLSRTRVGKKNGAYCYFLRVGAASDDIAVELGKAVKDAILLALEDALEPQNAEGIVARLDRGYSLKYIRNIIGDLKREGKIEIARVRSRRAEYVLSDAGRLRLVELNKGTFPELPLNPPPPAEIPETQSAEAAEPPPAAEALPESEAASYGTPTTPTDAFEIETPPPESRATEAPADAMSAAGTASPTQRPVLTASRRAAIQERLRAVFELVADELAAIVADALDETKAAAESGEEDK